MTRRPRRWAPAVAGVAFVALAAYVGWSLRPAADETPAGPPAEVLTRLARGVNVSGWLQHGDARGPAGMGPNADDWARIRALGFSHVRILADPAAFIGDRGFPYGDGLTRLRAAIEAARRENLLVVLALQLPTSYKLRLERDEADRQALGGTWRTIASALRGVSERDLVLEPLNEPEVEDAAASRAILLHLVAEIRAVLPDHTLAVSGHRYAGVDELAAMTPLPDRNLVYTFHFYEPHNFTHQGATWGDPKWKPLRRVPYPSSPEAVAPLLGAAPRAVQALLRWHGEERWGVERLGYRFDKAAQWGALHGVPVWCSEFGVLKKRARLEHRLAWLRDVRQGLETRGIPWTIWDYAGDFGVVVGPAGRRVDDVLALEALGLGRS